MAHLRILEKGLFDCFEPHLTDADGEPVNAEISAVAWDGHQLVVASDKDVPGAQRSPVFAFDLDTQGRPDVDSRRYYTAELVRHAQKYEDFALTVEGAHLVATTGFDRVDDESSALNHYNRLLVWPVERPDAPVLVDESEADGVRSSVALRAHLAEALGAPYYKIEGLATVPARDGGDDRLLFGIREVGASHDDFAYVCRVVAVPYRMDGDTLRFTGDFEVVYDFDASRYDGIRFEVGLSSLEYDPHGHGLYLLTSFEVEDAAGEDQVGAYLWWISLADFDAGHAPALVRAHDGSVFEFANKAEGVAVLPDGKLFVVYDPDRDLSLEAEHPHDHRAPHEAPYTLLAVDADGG